MKTIVLKKPNRNFKLTTLSQLKKKYSSGDEVYAKYVSKYTRLTNLEKMLQKC